MINSIIEAISIALNAEFTDKEISVHMEEIKQDLKEPCFFISCLNPTHELFLGKRYRRTNNFVIQYFPESEKYQRECNAVAERLYNCLEYITVDGDARPIYGDGMSYEIMDGVLNFFVKYDFFVRKKEENFYMESMEENIEIEDGD